LATVSLQRPIIVAVYSFSGSEFVV